MKKLFVLFCLLACSSAMQAQPDAPQPVAPALPQPPHDLTSPENAVRSFVAAFNLFDTERALACVYKANTRNRANLLRQMQRAKESKTTYTLKNVKIELDKTPQRALAFADYQYERDSQRRITLFHTSERLNLVRDGEEWKVMSGDPAYHWTAAQGGSLQTAATQIAHPEIWEDAARCQRNANNLAAAVIFQISRKNKGRFAISQKATEAKTEAEDKAKWSSLKQALASELKDDYGPNPSWFFHCPADGEDPEKESYSFNQKLDGIEAKNVVEPQNVVLIYEGKDEKFSFRHDGRASVVFVDGHVELLNAEQVKTLRWTPHKP